MCVCDVWRKWDVRGAGLDYNIVTRDLRTPAKNVREHWARAWAGIRQAQSGTSSRSGRNRASSSWKRRQTGSSSWSGCRNRAREQLKRTQAASSSWSGRNWGAALHRELSGGGLRTVGERGGGSWASEASSATCKNEVNKCKKNVWRCRDNRTAKSMNLDG